MYKSNLNGEKEFALCDRGFKATLEKNNRLLIKGISIPEEEFTHEYTKLFPIVLANKIYRT